MYAKHLATQNIFSGHFPPIIAKSAAEALIGLNVLTEELWLQKYVLYNNFHGHKGFSRKQRILFSHQLFFVNVGKIQFLALLHQVPLA